MQITDVLRQMGGLQSIAKELGVSETQAANGAAALAPAILGGFKKQAQTQPAGLDGLGGLLGKLGGGELLDDVLAPQPTNVGRGNDVLGQIFGSKDVSRTVAQNASANTGLSPELLKKNAAHGSDGGCGLHGEAKRRQRRRAERARGRATGLRGRGTRRGARWVARRGQSERRAAGRSRLDARSER